MSYLAFEGNWRLPANYIEPAYMDAFRTHVWKNNKDKKA